VRLPCACFISFFPRGGYVRYRAVVGYWLWHYITTESLPTVYVRDRGEMGTVLAAGLLAALWE
jgi:hypothetical protein